MSTKTKNVEVLIPESIQNKIDDGDYRIMGTQVRDRKGRIVCNLDSLDSGENKYFSPQIFQSFEGCTFLSYSIVSSKLQEALRGVQSRISELDLKIDKVLSRQTNDLIGVVVDFDEHFNSLMEGSKLTSEKETFQSGVRAASLLASHIEDYLNDFKDSTIIFHRDSNYDGEVYFQYMQRGILKSIVTRRRTSRFSDHQANFFAYSFLKVMNNINILSIAYDKKLFARYEESLDVLEGKLKSVLRFLVHEIGEEGDIYHMCYSTRGCSGTYYPMDIERVIRHDEGTNIHDLILRNFPEEINLEYDEGRVRSISDIIDLLEEIENLKLRSEQLKDLKISDLSEIVDVKREIFKLE